MGNLEGLPPEPPLLKKFNKSSFSYDDILATHRNASVPGLNGIHYKVYKKCVTKNKFIFKNFQACSKGAKSPPMAKCSRDIYS